MKVGERYLVKPTFTLDRIGKGRYMTGTVVYVHPKNRYAVLQFSGVHGSVRECFWPEQLTDQNRR